MVDTLMSGIIPQNDAQRLAALQRYKLLGTPPEESFNNMARIMADVFHVPIALISLVDKEKVFFKGNVGMPGIKYTDRSASLCSFAILSSEPTVFEKPLEEPCLLANPLVHGDFGLRFYAGAPLTTHDGFNIGSVCIVDKNERTFSSAEQDMLIRFSKLVMDDIELRLAATKQAEAEQQLQAANEELQFVTNMMPQLVWACEADGYAYFFNHRWIEYTGLSVEEVQGNGWVQALHPDDVEGTLNAWYHAVHTGNIYEVEYRVRRHDGVYRWFLVRGTPMKDNGGQIIRWYGTTTDIHDQKEAARALRESEERLRKVVSIDTVGVIYFDLDGTIHEANNAFEQMSGYTHEELKSGSARWGKLTPPGFMEATLKSRDEFLTKGQNTPYEREYIRPDGSRWWGLFAGKRLSEKECVEFVVDITEAKRAEEELENKVRERTQDLENLNSELKRTNQNLEEFAYAASHDLKEPIRKIHFYLDRLKERLEDKLDAVSLRYFERLEMGASRMSTLVDDLLLYSHISRGISGFEMIDLNKILSLVLEDLELSIEEKKAQIIVDPLPFIMGHQRQMQQLFENLIGNALKYSKPDLLPVVKISSRQVVGKDTALHLAAEAGEKQYYQIEVADNGIGFDQEDAERIFNVFTRLHGNAEYKGTGVGLSIVRKVAENHKGYVWAESKEGEGATFKILLPPE